MVFLLGLLVFYRELLTVSEITLNLLFFVGEHNEKIITYLYAICQVYISANIVIYSSHTN